VALSACSRQFRALCIPSTFECATLRTTKQVDNFVASLSELGCANIFASIRTLRTVLPLTTTQIGKIRVATQAYKASTERDTLLPKLEELVVSRPSEGFLASGPLYRWQGYQAHVSLVELARASLSELATPEKGASGPITVSGPGEGFFKTTVKLDDTYTEGMEERGCLDISHTLSLVDEGKLLNLHYVSPDLFDVGGGDYHTFAYNALEEDITAILLPTQHRPSSLDKVTFELDLQGSRALAAVPQSGVDPQIVTEVGGWLRSTIRGILSHGRPQSDEDSSDKDEWVAGPSFHEMNAAQSLLGLTQVVDTGRFYDDPEDIEAQSPGALQAHLDQEEGEEVEGSADTIVEPTEIEPQPLLPLHKTVFLIDGVRVETI
jgi:hypothetical protein